MAFIIRIPTITEAINGNTLMLTVGGVRAYNQENLYSKKTFERFKFFIGFQNMVCCNPCISTDGFQQEIRAMSLLDLTEKIIMALESYKSESYLSMMKQLTNYTLTERQFAQLIGKSKLYQYLPKKDKALLPQLLLNDGHIFNIAKDDYFNESFRCDNNGQINLWNIYNLFTGANKASYIDTFLGRGANAFSFF